QRRVSCANAQCTLIHYFVLAVHSLMSRQSSVLQQTNCKIIFFSIDHFYEVSRTTNSYEILVEGICLILINLRCVLIMPGNNTPPNFFPLYSYQNETLHFFVLQVSLKMYLNMQMSYTLIEYAQNTPKWASFFPLLLPQ